MSLFDRSLTVRLFVLRFQPQCPRRGIVRSSEDAIGIRHKVVPAYRRVYLSHDLVPSPLSVEIFNARQPAIPTRATQITHVTLLHMSERKTQLGRGAGGSGEAATELLRWIRFRAYIATWYGGSNDPAPRSQVAVHSVPSPLPRHCHPLTGSARRVRSRTVGSWERRAIGIIP